LTSYKIDYSGILEGSRNPRKWLKTLVEVTGFEPVTPCLQSTRFSERFCSLLICEVLTDYKFDYSGFFRKSQNPRKLLKTNGRGRGI